MDLSGQTVFITGASKRIGRALAIYLARAGADIFLHYGTSAAEAEETAHTIQGLGRKAFLLQGDLVDPTQPSVLIDTAWKIQPFQHLINNAAVFEASTWDTTSPLDWQRTMNVNLTAPFFLSQQFALKLKGHPGRIVNILDWRALRPGADHLPYTISKAGLAAVTRSMAQALAPNITVNGLALGAVLPPSDGGKTDSILKNIPLSRWADLDEVGAAVLFLLTGSGYITGDIIQLDGGRHLV